MNIYLLGYMGSGKSTIGRLLAKALGYDFLDFDAYIVDHEQMSITQIFQSKGEIYFRKKEAFYLEQLIQEKKKKTIISLGGGTPCYGQNLAHLKQTGDLTLYINVSYTKIARRLWVAREERPLISGIDSYDALEDYVRKHLFERGFFYNQAAKVVKVSVQSPEEVVEEIVASLF